MKGFCYLLLIVVFFVYYQKDPVSTILIVSVIVSVVFLYKRKRSPSKGVKKGIFGSNIPPGGIESNNTATFLALDQFISDNDEEDDDSEELQRIRRIDEMKTELLELFD